MNFITTILRGFSYLYFSQNVLFGLATAILLGILSPVILVMAIVGNLTGVLVAMLLGVKQSVVDTGAYGFNGVLIGAMVAFYVKQVPLALFLTIVASAIAALIYYQFSKNNIPAFALPFALMGWALLILLKFLKP